MDSDRHSQECLTDVDGPQPQLDAHEVSQIACSVEPPGTQEAYPQQPDLSTLTHITTEPAEKSVAALDGGDALHYSNESSTYARHARQSYVTFAGIHHNEEKDPMLEPHHGGSWDNDNETWPSATVRPSGLLLRKLSQNRSHSMRRTSVAFDKSGSMRRSALAIAPLQDSSVGFMFPTDVLPTCDPQVTGRNRFFIGHDHRRTSLVNGPQHPGAGKLAQDNWPQGHACGQESITQSQDAPIPLPLVAVIRHMHATARRAVLDAMLRLGPDSSGFSAYTPIFSIIPTDLRVHKLHRGPLPPQDLVRSMEVIAARNVPTVTAPASQRERVYALLSDPSSSRAARAVSGIILAGISASTAAYCYETMPSVPRGPTEAARLQVVEVTMVVLFTAEYVTRLVCCPQLRAFLTSPMNAIDVLSVLPYYISLLSEQLLGGWARRGVTRVLRVVRLVRIFRVAKVGAQYSKMRIIANVFGDTVEILWMLVLLVALAVLVFSTLVYYIELMELQTEPDDPRVTFRSIPGTFWWSVVTLLTVGYGDVVPGTTSGKVVAAFSMVVAVLLMALPVSVIGTTFTQHWVAFQIKERREARTLHAHGTLCELALQISTHSQAMDDISAAVDKCCVRLRICLHELYRLEVTLRNVYISGISGSVVASLAATQLSAKVRRFNRVLTHARRTYLELQCVLNVAESIMDPELISLAHDVEESYMHLGWWFAEAHNVLRDYSAIMEQNDGIHALLASQPPVRRIRL